MDADGVIRHAARLSQRRHLHCQGGRHTVKTTCRNLHIGSHRAVDSIAEAESPWLEVVEPLANQWRIPREHRGGFAHHAIPFHESGNAGAHSIDDTGEFMTEDNGIIYAPTLLAMILMQVASTNTHRLDPQQNIFLTDFGNRNFPKLNRT